MMSQTQDPCNWWSSIIKRQDTGCLAEAWKEGSNLWNKHLNLRLKLFLPKESLKRLKRVWILSAGEDIEGWGDGPGKFWEREDRSDALGEASNGKHSSKSMGPLLPKPRTTGPPLAPVGKQRTNSGLWSSGVCAVRPVLFCIMVFRRDASSLGEVLQEKQQVGLGQVHPVRYEDPSLLWLVVQEGSSAGSESSWTGEGIPSSRHPGKNLLGEQILGVLTTKVDHAEDLFWEAAKIKYLVNLAVWRDLNCSFQLWIRGKQAW